MLKMPPECLCFREEDGGGGRSPERGPVHLLSGESRA